LEALAVDESEKARNAQLQATSYSIHADHQQPSKSLPRHHQIEQKNERQGSPFPHVQSNLQHHAQIHEPDRDQQQGRTDHPQDCVFIFTAIMAFMREQQAKWVFDSGEPEKPESTPY
jgi:hypothetical protein